MKVTGRTDVSGEVLITTHVRVKCPHCGRIMEKTETETRFVVLEDVQK